MNPVGKPISDGDFVFYAYFFVPYSSERVILHQGTMYIVPWSEGHYAKE